MRANLLHVGIVLGAGIIVGVGSYLIVASFVLLNSIVPLYVLAITVLGGISLAFLYDYLGPTVPPEL